MTAETELPAYLPYPRFLLKMDISHTAKLAPVEEHSKKPDVVRDKIVTLMGDLPRIELFARQTPPGWDVWGNEVDSDITL